MSWTVGYGPGIRGEALEVWAVSPDLVAARAALSELESRLAADPHAPGRHLHEGLWKIIIPPFAACYTIDPVRRHVEITAVDTAS